MIGPEFGIWPHTFSEVVVKETGVPGTLKRFMCID